MIKIVRGDLLQATENIIAHQTNCQGVMGSGIAKQIKDKYPKVFEEYLEFTKHYIEYGITDSILGKIQGVDLGDNKYVVNIFGQNKYGYDGKQYTDTEALFTGLKQLRKVAEKNGLSVALPYMIGCYRGGADWKHVEDLILTAFDEYEVTLYKLHRG